MSRVAATIVFAGAALAAATGIAADAQTGGEGRGQRVEEMKKRFAAADTDHDGRLTRAEAKAGMPRVHEHFDEIDTARSGSIGMGDIARWAMKMRGGASRP